MRAGVEPVVRAGVGVGVRVEVAGVAGVVRAEVVRAGVEQKLKREREKEWVQEREQK